MKNVWITGMIDQIRRSLKCAYSNHVMVLIICPVLIHCTCDENSQEYVKLFKCDTKIRVSEKNKFFKYRRQIVNPVLLVNVIHWKRHCKLLTLGIDSSYIVSLNQSDEVSSVPFQLFKTFSAFCGMQMALLILAFRWAVSNIIAAWAGKSRSRLIAVRAEHGDTVIGQHVNNRVIVQNELSNFNISLCYKRHVEWVISEQSDIRMVDFEGGSSPFGSFFLSFKIYERVKQASDEFLLIKHIRFNSI